MTEFKDFTANATPAEGDFWPSWLASQAAGSERKTTLAQLRTALLGTSSFAVGDLFYASSATALARLADVATGNVLLSGGVTTAPAWGKVSLTAAVSGVLPEANGGTNQAAYTQGNLLYASAADTLAKLPKNTSASRYLSNTGASNAPSWAQVNLANGTTGTLGPTSGGTGVAAYTQGDIVYSDATNSLAKLPKSTTATRSLTNTGTNNAPAWAQVDLTTGVTATLPGANGGTGNQSYTIGDLLQASGTTALTPLPAVATGNALISGGVATASNWGKVTLTGHVSGVLPEANGGSGQSSYAVGDILYASGATALSKLADVATGNVLLSGGVTTAPAWGKVDLTAHVTGVLPHANGGGPLCVSLGSDMAAYATVALQDMTNMSFSVTSTRRYIGKFFVPFSVAATSTGIVLSLNAGSGLYGVQVRIQDAANGTVGAFLEAASAGTATSQTLTFPTVFAI